VLICGAGLAIAACGGSSGSSSAQPGSAGSTSATASSGSATSAPSAPSGSGDQAQITANWEAFFLSSTPLARRVALLENGSQFQSVIKAQASSPLASSATAKVTKVTVTSATQAQVVYSILVGGASALPNQKGVAVKQGGTWKVGDQSFCSLLGIENGGNSTKLPAACH
jgi:hypothetical protein